MPKSFQKKGKKLLWLNFIPFSSFPLFLFNRRVLKYAFWHMNCIFSQISQSALYTIEILKRYGKGNNINWWNKRDVCANQIMIHYSILVIHSEDQDKYSKIDKRKHKRLWQSLWRIFHNFKSVKVLAHPSSKIKPQDPQELKVILI